MSLRPRSVRMRLTLWYAGALGVALAAYAVFVYLVIWGVLSAQVDRQLQQDIGVTLRMLEDRNGTLVWDEDEEGAMDAIPRVEVVSSQGAVLFHSPSFPKDLSGGFRVLEMDGTVEEHLPVHLRAARPTAPMHRELRFLAFVLACGIPLAVLLAGGGGYLMARGALAPIDRMAARAAAITAERLSERLPVANPHDELGRLGVVFNQAFARLEASFDQLRRFTADASHELRTPLTALRSIGEVGLDQPRGGEEYRDIIGSMLEEADRLARLVESLLVLSRADGGQIRLGSEPVDLAALARDVADQLAVLAEEKSQRVDVHAPCEVPFVVDPAVLRRAVINLVDNAIKYSPEGAAIRVSVEGRDGRAIIEVRDEGPGIAEEHRPHVFDRFYRVDKARSREFGGVGLGLSIARWAVEAHGGVIEVESEPGAGSTFRISLPIGTKT